MVKFNDYLYYYPKRKRIKRGMLGATIFIVKGDKAQFMVDPAVLGGNVEKYYENLMVADGIKIEDTERIFVTHCHPDHSVAAYYWQKRISEDIVPIMVHPQGADYLKDPKRLVKDLVAEAGWIKKEISKAPVHWTSGIFNLLWTEPKPAQKVETLKDNQEFDLGNIIFRVEFTEGHTLNHVSYRIIEKETKKSILLSGDLISFKEIERGKGIQGLASVNTVISDFSKSMASLKRIMNDPPDILFTSHYGIFQPKEEVVVRFKEALDLAETFKPRVLEYLKSGPKSFAKINKHLIYFKGYLSGYATRTSSTYCVIRELMQEGLIEEVDKKKHIFALTASNKD
jgi:glyoxylase-like metal-dependent hydrolase (beta-lactamase superfamily II)